MNAALVAVVLSVAAVEEQVSDVPRVTNAPGATAYWIGGGLLGVAAEFTLINVCIGCGANIDMHLQTIALTTVGVVALLGGMMWTVWRQPADEPVSMTPGYAAATMGVVQIAAGVLGAMPPFGSSASRRDLQPQAFAIGAGITALAAGVTWLIWAHRR